MGLLEPQSGNIKIDNKIINQQNCKLWQKNVGYVPQDIFISDEDIASNIAFGSKPEDVNLEKVISSAKVANLHNFIEKLPDGYLTKIGERGIRLSGGQKQRATLARGLIRKAPVLILDDCFSAVDTETEEHILSELKRVRAGQTTILVSHRVSTARHADNIIVLDEGVVIEKGSHEELLLEGGYYAELERVQREGGQDGDLKNKRAGVR